MSVRIIGTGSYLPKKVADNNFLSTIVDTDDEWIRQRTGIKERHLSNGKEGTTYMAAHAAEAALENAGIGADELDMIIVATVSADTYVPVHPVRYREQLARYGQLALILMLRVPDFYLP